MNSRINGKDLLTLNSGNDTVLSGAQAIGDKIVVNVGHDLTITSLQDLDNYKSQQMSASGGASLTIGSMTGSASLSVSKSKASSEYASVGDQSGLFAGNQGFDINVGNHTQLNGAVIASTAEAANNSLSTGTLGWRDIENKADYKSSTVGISGGYAKGLDDNKEATHAGGALPVSINRSGSASGTTYSAIADGTLTVRNQEQQAQDISTLSHDTENANGHISKIFDKDKIEQDQAFSQALGDAAIQTINNIGQQMQLNAREDAYNKLAGNEQFLKASAEEQARMINADPDYIKAQKSFAIGSPFWTAGTAISGALAGLAGGNTSQMLAGGLAPYLALAVKKATTDEKNNVNMPANIAGHALAGAVVAYLQGGSVAGGAAGAAGGELAAHAIMAELYPNSSVDSLTNEQKANISALSTLAAGLAGGIAGNSSNAIGSGAVAGKVAVENNSLSDIAEALAAGKTPQQVAKERVEDENERYKKENCAGMSAEACSVKMYDQRREELKGILSTGADFVPVVGTIKSAAEAQSALDYLNLAASLIPGERVALGVLKAAEKALAKGDVAEASKLMKQANNEIKVKWVDENAGMSQRARDYNDPASGARSNIDTQKGQVPSIDRIDANGKNRPVRFDGVDDNVMIDRKISVVTTQKVKDQALRQSEALKNNGMTGRWKVPNQAQANRAQKMFDELGIKNIEVKIVKE